MVPPGLRHLGSIQIRRALVDILRVAGIEKVTLIRDRKTGMTSAVGCCCFALNLTFPYRYFEEIRIRPLCYDL